MSAGDSSGPRVQPHTLGPASVSKPWPGMPQGTLSADPMRELGVNVSDCCEASQIQTAGLEMSE